MSTLGIISPILQLTYGEGAMVDDLAIYLAKRIDEWTAPLSREDMIRMVCWDWMTGGTTAQAVATRIEEALRRVEPEQGPIEQREED